MNAREKRIYALAQKWAKLESKQHLPIYIDCSIDLIVKQVNGIAVDKERARCGRALLKLFKEREGREKDSG